METLDVFRQLICGRCTASFVYCIAKSFDEHGMIDQAFPDHCIDIGTVGGVETSDLADHDIDDVQDRQIEPPHLEVIRVPERYVGKERDSTRYDFQVEPMLETEIAVWTSKLQKSPPYGWRVFECLQHIAVVR